MNEPTEIRVNGYEFEFKLKDGKAVLSSYALPQNMRTIADVANYGNALMTLIGKMDMMELLAIKPPTENKQ